MNRVSSSKLEEPTLTRSGDAENNRPAQEAPSTAQSSNTPSNTAPMVQDRNGGAMGLENCDAPSGDGCSVTVGPEPRLRALAHDCGEDCGPFT